METRNGPSADDAAMRREKRAHLFLSGTVQGVGMRAYIEQLASSFGLSGWVKNISDGRVETLLQGEKVEEVIREIEKGRFARYIREIETSWVQAKNDLKGFEIRW